MTERRCVVCGAPAADHVPLRYALKTAVRHRAITVAGWVLGRLPLTMEDVAF